MGIFHLGSIFFCSLVVIFGPILVCIYGPADEYQPQMKVPSNSFQFSQQLVDISKHSLWYDVGSWSGQQPGLSVTLNDTSSVRKLLVGRAGRHRVEINSSFCQDMS